MRRELSNIVPILAFLALTACGSDNTNNAPGATGTGTVSGGCAPISAPIGFTATNILYYPDQGFCAGNVPGTGGAGGSFCPAGQYGNAIVGGGGAGGPFQRSGVDGNISMNITTTQQGGQGGGIGGGFGGLPAQITNGVLQISQITQQDILYNFGFLGGFPGGGGQPGNPLTNICVSQIAFDMKLSGTTIYDGFVYLYIGNLGQGVGQGGPIGGNGYVLYF